MDNVAVVISLLEVENFVEAVEAAQVLLVVMFDRFDELLQADLVAQLHSHAWRQIKVNIDRVQLH